MSFSFLCDVVLLARLRVDEALLRALGKVLTPDKMLHAGVFGDWSDSFLEWSVSLPFPMASDDI